MRVETIAVVGSGLMGRGIAYAAAAGGYRTLLHDVSPEALEHAQRQIRADLDEGRARGKLTAGEADAAYERLRLEPDLKEAVAEAGFVIEAVPERIDLKLQMLEEGVASARDIDKALKLGLNHPMGPFELVDVVGLDTRLSVLEFLHRMLGEKYRPAPLLVQHVKAGRLGKKVGRGVYNYAHED